MRRIVKWKNQNSIITGTGNVYYLNTTNGNDSYDGLNTYSAWKTQAHAEAVLENNDVLLSKSTSEGSFPKAAFSDYTMYKLNDVLHKKQIIANHSIVDDYTKIPQSYIDEVKKMLFKVVGESHAGGYMYGLQSLENADADYAVSLKWYGTAESYTASNLRAWYDEAGEEDWFTNSTAITTIKNMITTQNNTGNILSVLLFGWCWDMTWINSPTATKDAVYGCGWAGTSSGGPDGNLQWGLDSGDSAITGNSVCMDTYLDATQGYVDHDSNTVVVFTTGPVDSYTGENGYQRELKHQYIRDYVSQDSTRILFDYADILAYNNSNVRNTITWDGHTYSQIHDDNTGNYDGGNGVCHIGEVGCIRLAKALWWMLARIAGWDGI